MVRILGIDPGSRITGYGVIQLSKSKPYFVDTGVIRVNAKSLPEKLEQIFSGITEVINHYKPDQVSIEEVFVHKNPGGALKLGQARGAAIVAASIRSLPTHEYTARQIKQAVVGYGNADKLQIQQMVMLLLKLESSPSADAADALAVALCHGQVLSSGLFQYMPDSYKQGRLK